MLGSFLHSRAELQLCGSAALFLWLLRNASFGSLRAHEVRSTETCWEMAAAAASGGSKLGPCDTVVIWSCCDGW